MLLLFARPRSSLDGVRMSRLPMLYDLDSWHMGIFLSSLVIQAKFVSQDSKSDFIPWNTLSNNVLISWIPLSTCLEVVSLAGRRPVLKPNLKLCVELTG